MSFLVPELLEAQKAYKSAVIKRKGKKTSNNNNSCIKTSKNVRSGRAQHNMSELRAHG